MINNVNSLISSEKCGAKARLDIRKTLVTAQSSERILGEQAFFVPFFLPTQDPREV